jgi:hypothetical protein
MLTVLDDKERPMHTLSKDSVRSPRKIDAAMAAVLAWEARGACIAAGGVGMTDFPVPPDPTPPEPWRPGFAPAADLQPTADAGPMGFMS